MAGTQPTIEQQADTAIHTLSAALPEAALDDLRRRIPATRSPKGEVVNDRSPDGQLAAMQGVLHYWADEYDLGRFLERLNALPQFTTEVDSVTSTSCTSTRKHRR